MREVDYTKLKAQTHVKKKLKKFEIILKLSFAPYLMLVLFATPYITAQLWADVVWFLSILSAAYQLTYILFLRKKDGVSFGKSIANLFLYASLTVYIAIILAFVIMFFAGYCQPPLLSSCSPDYGLQAWHNAIHSMFFIVIIIPSFVLCAIYQAGYFFINKKLAKRSSVIHNA